MAELYICKEILSILLSYVFLRAGFCYFAGHFSCFHFCYTFAQLTHWFFWSCSCLFYLFWYIIDEFLSLILMYLRLATMWVLDILYSVYFSMASGNDVSGRDGKGIGNSPRYCRVIVQLFLFPEILLNILVSFHIRKGLPHSYGRTVSSFTLFHLFIFFRIRSFVSVKESTSLFILPASSFIPQQLFPLLLSQKKINVQICTQFASFQIWSY